jgi:hypothetical protein
LYDLRTGNVEQSRQGVGWGARRMMRVLERVVYPDLPVWVRVCNDGGPYVFVRGVKLAIDTLLGSKVIRGRRRWDC